MADSANREESKRDGRKSSLHTTKEVSFHFHNKQLFYEAAVRNWWYLPKFKSSIITEDYISDVVNGRVYCPKYSDIKLKPCPKAPDKEILMFKLENILPQANINLPLGFDEIHQPDKPWLLAVLATVYPACDIFKKGYVPEPKVPKYNDTPNVELPDDFLDDLPLNPKRVKHRKLKIFSKEKLIKESSV